MSKVRGPAAQLIDFGYAVKLPLCEVVDRVYGVENAGIWSLTGFLHLCYEVRRPYFVLADMLAMPPGWR